MCMVSLLAIICTKTTHTTILTFNTKLKVNLRSNSSPEFLLLNKITKYQNLET